MIIDEVAISLAIILVSLEYFEISWQKGKTLKELLSFNFVYYEYNMYIYFLKHTAFIFMIFALFLTNIFNVYTMTLVFMKFVDIGFKLYIIQNIKLHGIQYIDNLFDSKDFPLSLTLRYSNMVIYPLFLYIGLTQ